MKPVFFTVLLAIAGVSVTATQDPASVRFDRAYVAWDAGDYVPALEGFAAILAGPDADTYHDRIALVTGELYQVTELTTDGRTPRFSATGRYAVYDAGTRFAPVTRVIEADTGRAVADIAGTGLVFSPDDGRVAFLRVKETPDIRELRKQVATLSTQPAPDRQALADRQRQLASLEARTAEIVIREMRGGGEQTVPTGALLKATPVFTGDGRDLYFVGAAEGDPAATNLYVTSGGEPKAITSGPGFKVNPVAVPGGRYLLYSIAGATPFPAPGAPSARPAGAPGGGAMGARQFVVTALADGRATTFDGTAPAVSADGSTLAFLGRVGDENAVSIVRLSGDLKPVVVKKSPERIGSPAVSPDGSRVAYDLPYTRNTEIFCLKSDGTGELRVTREIQPDRGARFVTGDLLLAVKGESRHTRSYLYDLRTMAATKLFHNNTVRTIAPEYEWAASPSGGQILVQAERDGDTISPERGIYLLDLRKKVRREDLRARLASCLAAEKALRASGQRMFRPIAAQVRKVADRASIAHLYEYESALFDFDSKHITMPGNKLAGEYIHRMFASFGYEPVDQWFTSRGVKTANILATLEGTENPELVYVLSSHYDSNQRGPGADDNSSATAVLLETARALANTPMPATIIFAAFTGEEAGLLGSREFVRQAVEKKMHLVGALNNDMIGWCNDHRLDNTIRYSNAGIRDAQHAASFLFSKMITYDAHYFKSTDAAAYYEAYGDIVGGFGSYPVLGNPYYHQPTDLLETVNHQLLLEATRANIASIMLLASSPSRLEGLQAGKATDSALDVSWTASPERGVTAYTIQYGPASHPAQFTRTVAQPRAHLPLAGVKKGENVHVAVRATGSNGAAGWDWARVVVTRSAVSNE